MNVEREKTPHYWKECNQENKEKEKIWHYILLKKLPDYHEGLASEFISEILNIYMHTNIC